MAFDITEDQLEELEALQAIYEDDFSEISRCPPCFMVKLQNLPECIPAGSVLLKVTFPADYPSVCPVLEIPMRSSVLSPHQCSGLLEHLATVASENVGQAMVFTLVSEAEQWLPTSIPDTSQTNSTDTDSDLGLAGNTVGSADPLATVKLIEPPVARGRWDYVIGLIGKPSAGKSTFFNACTSLDLARTGAHPFTTIEPNIGKAFYSIPCPCSRRESRCNAAHGHNIGGDRYVPVLLKDVAGLVPGAWEGKGKGNRFLNDLLDSDVLIHIVDVSGTTDEKGEETKDYDPANDIHWLQEEIHQWIYQNVLEKWDNILKRPKKLIDMFTGYHASKSVIHTALRNSGIGEGELGSIAGWGQEVLHRIVKEFIKLRFPILLALNKADVMGAEANIDRVRDQFPDNSSIPVSAWSECYLQQLKRDEIIEYRQGAQTFTPVPQQNENPTVQLQLQTIQRQVLQQYCSTNVHNALCEAVKLRCPTYAFPVQCLESLRSIRKGHMSSHLEQEVLRECVSLKPGSTVEDLYRVLLHYPTQLLAGDFVRAEACLNGKRTPLKKDETITADNNVIHIMTNRKSS